jgi:AAA15 family ATPase/GTPase
MYKIRKLNIPNHEFLGNVDLDFLKSDGSAFDNVVFAGENGTGKTTILDLLTIVSSGSLKQQAYNPPPFFITIEIEINGIIYTIKYDNDPAHTIYDILKEDGSSAFPIRYPTDNLQILQSNVEINFKHDAIGSSKTSEVDIANGNILKSSEKLADEIAQLFVDITQLDALEYTEWSRVNQTFDASRLDIRMQRFKSAFKYMFGDMLRFKTIGNNGTAKTILFEKNGAEVELNGLSSGEKQVVYRSSFLLKDKNALTGCAVLIDEPELSMHPKWNQKIFDFLRTLFTATDGSQQSQVFIATHSAEILKSALNNDNTLIIKLHEGESLEKIYKGSPGRALPSVTLGEVKWRVFDVPTVDYHIELYSHIQAHKVVDRYGNIITDARGNRAIANTKETDEYLCSKGNVRRPSSFTDRRGKTLNYNGITTYIRNCIDHPDSGVFSEQELQDSIKFMISII